MGKAVLKSFMPVLGTCDDSNGNIGGVVESAAGLLEDIADADSAAMSIKEDMFAWFQKELNGNEYFDFVDFGYHLFDVFKKLAVQLNEQKAFLSLMQEQ